MSDKLAAKIAAIVLTSEDAVVIAESLAALGYNAAQTHLADYQATKKELIRCFKAGRQDPDVVAALEAAIDCVTFVRTDAELETMHDLCRAALAKVRP